MTDEEQTVTARAISEQTAERIRLWAKPEFFGVDFHVDPELVSELSAEEQNKLIAKLDLVRTIAQKLAANMTKGVIKYPQPEGSGARDAMSLRYWLESALDDAVDAVNYMHPLKQEMQVAGTI